MNFKDNKNRKINIFPTRYKMGVEAAARVEEYISELLKSQNIVRVVFAAAPSQIELLKNLRESKIIDWSRIKAYNMDEYIGLGHDNPNSFAYFLKYHLFDRVQTLTTDLINGSNRVDKELVRYEKLLTEDRIDVICLGIGENGHIAFNDPPVADFSDPLVVKEVELDLSCRKQQVNEGCFEALEKVPRKAITITIPTIMAVKKVFCVVPGERKRKAVYESLHGPVTTKWPASILQKHNACEYFFDHEAYSFNERVKG